MIHAQMNRQRVVFVKRKAPWHGLDSAASKNSSNNDYYTPKYCSGWNQQRALKV